MKNSNVKLLSLSVAFGCMVGLASCSKPSRTEPEITPEADYQLKDIQYFMSDGDRIDTLMVGLGDTTIYNYSNAKLARKFTEDYSKLAKTSYFQVSEPNLLPADLYLEKFEVHVPSQLIADGSFSYFATKLPVSRDSVQVPYGKFWSDTVSINVPAKSKIVIDRSVQAHVINCSFKASIVNKTTGQNHEVRGSWKGLLRYDNLNTRLTEHPVE
ncbi:hypothetical protein DSL64_22100 [Dyadobacter luteus]|uniref:DUF1735 domain-containing protein n=1 Tax=Dyadobacter luteus TaxID=2259619 RepID=A0A3D8Y624_9BACT|nr:hypothetical protein [Dyadobacter luteus]REA58080.1 hypothetical protein DSL64_22100 [Dyadobacter luteus]